MVVLTWFLALPFLALRCAVASNDILVRNFLVADTWVHDISLNSFANSVSRSRGTEGADRACCVVRLPEGSLYALRLGLAGQLDLVA